MSNFKVTEGEKRGSTLWIYDGKGYIKDRELNDKIFLRCRRFKSDFCEGRAKIVLAENMLNITTAHSDQCTDTAEVFSIIELKSTLKRRAENTTSSIRQLFNDGVEGSIVADQICFPQLANSMVKRRRLMIPNIPQTPMEAYQVIVSDPNRFGKHFRSVVTGSNHSEVDPEMSLIFTSETMVSFIDEGNSVFLQLDATFSIVPQNFYQHLTIMVEEKDYMLPLFHILMTKKTESLYQSTFYEIKRLFPNLHPIHMMMDYERALDNSVKTVFPNIKLSGCRFHQNQAIYRKLTKLGMTHLYKDNENLRKWVRNLMALVLLPAENIEPTFRILSSQSISNLTTTQHCKVQQLKTYYKKYWLKQVGCEKMSVFALRRKTNNDMEIYNRWIKKIFLSNHPNIFRYLDCLNKNVSIWDRNLRSLRLGFRIRRSRSKVSINNDRRIIAHEQKLLSEEIMPITFIYTLSKQLEDCFEDEGSIDEDAVYSDDSDEDAVITQERPLCPVCRDVEKTVNTTFVPCGHTNCFDCASAIKNTGQHCPICRQSISDIMRVIFS